MSKIGIFGGSFNPIHNGHIYVADQVQKALCLDKIIFIPTGTTPHKDNSTLASNEHRYNMVRLAVGERFEVSNMEVTSSRVCYTVDTMSELMMKYPNDELYYIIGADSLVDFMCWKEPLKLFKMLHLVVVDRDDADIDAVAKEYISRYGAKITICHATPFDASSSEIRKLYAKDGTSCGLVPEAVEQYIIEHRLYTEV